MLTQRQEAHLSPNVRRLINWIGVKVKEFESVASEFSAVESMVVYCKGEGFSEM